MAGLWYRVGTISVTNGSKKVTGFGTQFKTGTYKPDKGHTFWGPDGKHYEVDYVESDTVLYLVQAYTGATAAGQSYEIDITRTGTIPALSREVSAMLVYAQGQYDAWQQILTGAGDVTLTAPDARQVTVPALSNMLSKSGNLAGLADKRAARVNLGLTAGSGASADDDITTSCRLMRWMNYGTGHTIFDASSGVSPSGGAIDRSNAHVPWSADRPSLMGWNGLDTYGVRVDSARVADTISNLASAQIQPRSRSLLTGGDPKWVLLGRFDPPSTGTLGTLHVRGYVGPWTGAKEHIDMTFKNRDGVSVSGYGTGAVDIRVQDIGGGAHEVWVFLPSYYLCELEVFSAGNGLTTWFVGEVVTDMPNGSSVWGGAQSMPVMLTTKNQTSGTWTPIINGVSDYSARMGAYIKTGRSVTISAYIAFLDRTVPLNDGNLRGLPFTPKNIGVGGYIPCALYRGGVADPDINAYLDSQNGDIKLNHPVSRNAVQFASNADYMFSVTYEIA